MKLSTYISPTGFLGTSGGTLTGALNAAPPVYLTTQTGFATPIGAAPSKNIVISGTAGITSFDVIPPGAERVVVFNTAITITHDPVALLLPGQANITTAINDVATFNSLGNGNWRCISYQYYDPTRARSGLGAAKSGANADITSLTGLVTPLAISQGGSGQTTVGPNGTGMVSNGTSLYWGAPTLNALQLTATTISASQSVLAGNNAISVGPTRLNPGVTVSVAPGQRWVIH